MPWVWKCSSWTGVAALAAVALCARGARGDATVVAAQVFYESPTLFVPALFVILPTDMGDELRIGQVGWTTTTQWTWALDPRVAFVGGVDVTPWFAHASNRIYVAGREVDADEYHDTNAEASLGLRLTPSAHVRGEARAVALAEAVDGASAEERATWRSGYGGVDASVIFEDVRSDDPYRSRIDGARGVAHARAMAGARPFVGADVEVTLGRRIGRLNVAADGLAAMVSIDSIVSRYLFGGSWDVLGAFAIDGHPYAEFRVTRAVAARARADVRIAGTWELGARAAGMVAAREGWHDGVAIETSVVVRGIYLFAGMATPDRDPARTLAFAGAACATLF